MQMQSVIFAAEALYTFCVQHLGDVKVLLSHFKGQVEVVHVVTLHAHTHTHVMTNTNTYTPPTFLRLS